MNYLLYLTSLFHWFRPCHSFLFVNCNWKKEEGARPPVNTTASRAATATLPAAQTVRKTERSKNCTPNLVTGDARASSSPTKLKQQLPRRRLMLKQKKVCTRRWMSSPSDEMEALFSYARMAVKRQKLKVKARFKSIFRPVILKCKKRLCF